MDNLVGTAQCLSGPNSSFTLSAGVSFGAAGGLRERRSQPAGIFRHGGSPGEGSAAPDIGSVPAHGPEDARSREEQARERRRIVDNAPLLALLGALLAALIGLSGALVGGWVTYRVQHDSLSHADRTHFDDIRLKAAEDVLSSADQLVSDATSADQAHQGHDPREAGLLQRAVNDYGVFVTAETTIEIVDRGGVDVATASLRSEIDKFLAAHDANPDDPKLPGLLENIQRSRLAVIALARNEFGLPLGRQVGP